MNEYALIRQAILDKKVIRARYKGHVRLMCPHVIGLKDGHEHALFYQFGGGSRTGISPGSRNNWRCICVNELSDVSIVEGAWHTANNHSRANSCVDQVDVEVAY